MSYLGRLAIFCLVLGLVPSAYTACSTVTSYYTVNRQLYRYPSSDRVWCPTVLPQYGSISITSGYRRPALRGTYSFQLDDGEHMVEIVIGGRATQAKGLSAGSAKAKALCYAKRLAIMSVTGQYPQSRRTTARCDHTPVSRIAPATTIIC